MFALLRLSKGLHTALYSSASCRFTHYLCYFPLLFYCCFLPSLLSFPLSLIAYVFPTCFDLRLRRALYASCRNLQGEVCDYGDCRRQTSCSPRVAGNDDVIETLQTRGVALSSAPHTDNDTTPTTTPHRRRRDSLMKIILISCLIAVLVVLFRGRPGTGIDSIMHLTAVVTI